MMEERRRPGRPRLDQPLSTVSTRLPPQVHDELIKLANHQEESVSETLRQLLILRLRPE